ncbi:DUF1493 family protein [Aequorivita sp. CIP111184]|uniref:DUF1493 family protein n=1 Tax=Aequorivita sp. CIP111184 TaxID=2211356 RepID=UPI0015ECB37B|nr:DUF1493 family protein [Aequorivita sp. CIP111184]
MEEKILLFFNDRIQKPIKKDSEINKYGFFGMDAIVLMSDFFEEFEIQNSEDFDIFSYFVEELSFIDFLKISYEKRLIQKPPLKIRHLIEVAEQKKWFSP